MSLIKVRWFGAVEDSSGYSASSRNYIQALSTYNDKELYLSVGSISFEIEKANHELSPLISAYMRKDNNPHIQITHLTPENYPKFKCKNPNTYNVGYTAWETSRLPDDWVGLYNSMDEIWVPSTYNVDVFRNSGVTKKIVCIPHIVPVRDDIESIPLFEQKGNNYWFYSIFQWTARKNPFCLLVSYFTEFWNTEGVVLALKTYRKNTSHEEKQIIRNDIENIKKLLRLPKYPPILFYSTIMDTKEMNKLHKTGDCFVLPSKAEGWGIPFAEAMSFGNPTIGARYSGNIDFMNDNNSLLVSAVEEPVYGMTWMSHYHGQMIWSNPSIMDVRQKMRFAFENKEAVKKIGLEGQKTIKDGYNSTTVGNMMMNRIKEIVKERGL